MRIKAAKNKLRFEVPVSALSRWNPCVQAAEKSSDTVFNIYSDIGENWDGTGVTPEKMQAFLEKADGRAITLNINSAGGDFFAGLAMHTMLSEYSGAVRVKVVGLAASAASMIAMAGDEVQIAEAGLMMIHNAWSVAIGNSKDMAEISTLLEKFDASMATLYTSATGLNVDVVRSMMDAETWMNGAEAVDHGFATSIMAKKDVVQNSIESPHNAALREVDLTLAKAGMPRSHRRELIKKITVTPCADNTDITPCADDEKKMAVLGALLKSINA